MRGEIESHSHILEQEQRNWTAAPEPQKTGEERDPIFEMLSHAEKCCVQKVKKIKNIKRFAMERRVLQVRVGCCVHIICLPSGEEGT